MLTLIQVVRLEWIYARATHERWKEHLTLTKEELCRLRVFFTHEEARRYAWKEKEPTFLPEGQMQAGYVAYANRQAQIYAALAAEAMQRCQDI